MGFLHTVMKSANLKSHQQRFLSKQPNIMFTCISAYTVYNMCILINMLLIVLIEHIKKLAEDTSLSEHIHKCKLSITTS